MKKGIMLLFIMWLAFGSLFESNRVNADGVEFTSISTSLYHSVALDDRGNIWAWGRNNYGQFGNGSKTEIEITTPTRIDMPVKFQQVKAGFYNTIGLDTEQRIWTVGRGDFGHLGNGSSSESLDWIMLEVNTTEGSTVNFTEVAINRLSSFALDDKGQLWGWGYVNGGSNVPDLIPVTDSGGPVRFTSISANDQSVHAIDSNHQIWEVYNSESSKKLVPNAVGATPAFRTISTGAGLGNSGFLALALDHNDNIWIWGTNTCNLNGDADFLCAQQGDGGADPNPRIEPTLLEINDGGSLVKFDQVSGGNNYVLALDKNGHLWSWGMNDYGQLGDETTTSGELPKKVNVIGSEGSVTFTSMSAGYGRSYGLAEDGRIWGWGEWHGITPAKLRFQPHVTLSVSPEHLSPQLEEVTLTAFVNGELDSLSGAVEFWSGGVLLDTRSLIGGMASLTISNLPVGTHSLSVNYLGDDNYIPLQSEVVSYTINEPLVPVEPVITLTSTPTNDTNGLVTVSAGVVIDGGDRGNALTELKWLAGNRSVLDFADSAGTSILSGFSFTVSANGIYTVYARDSVGNEVVETISITNIDRQAPVIGLIPSSTSPTNGNVSIAVGVEEVGSGIRNLKWASGEQTVSYFASEGEILNASNQFTVSENGIYTVYALDNAGNEAVETITIANIYRAAPSINLQPSPTTATNGDVTVAVTVVAGDNDLEITSLKWSIGNQPVAYFTNEGEVLTEPNKFVVNQNGIYTVYARDNAGNEAVGTITITNIHRTAPGINLQPSPTGPTNGDVTIAATVTAADDNLEISSIKWASGDQEADYFASEGKVLTGSNEFTVSENGTYTVYAIDSVGNEAVATISIANIDRQAPTIELAPSLTAPTNGNVIVTVEVEESGSGISDLKWARGEQAEAYFASGGQDVSASNDFTVSENDVYTVYARDNAGNEAIETITIANIDRQAPAIELLPSLTSPTNENVVVAVEVEEAGSGINSLKWARGEQTEAYFVSEGEEVSAANEITVSENGIYTVYARDNAGNEAVATITIANIYRTAPSIDLLSSPTNPTNDDVTIAVTTIVADDKLEIASLKWASGDHPAGYFASEGEEVSSSNDFAVSDNGIYTVYARDSVGNEAVETITIANIYRTAPSIDLLPSQTNPTNGNVMLAVTATAADDNLEIANLKWANGDHPVGYFASDGEVLAAPNEFTVSANGIYTVYARDNAGNEAVETITIANIYQTVPAIDLLLSPTSPTNGDVTVVATVAAADDALEIASLKWAIGEQTLAYFASSGQVLTELNEFTVSDNGIYTVYARDSVGNEAVETITIANIYRIAPSIDLLPSPTSTTSGNVTVTVTVTAADDDLEITSLKWASGEQEADYFASEGEEVSASNEFTVSRNGDYTVYVRDNAGNETVESITIQNIYRPAPTQPDEPETKVELEGGVIIIRVSPKDIVEVDQDNGEIIEKVDLPEEVLNQIPKLLEELDRPIIRIEINDRKSAVQLPLPAELIEKVQNISSDVVFEARLNGSSFQLEVSVLDLKGLAAQLGTDVKNLDVNIIIKAVTGTKLNVLVQTAEQQGMQLLSQAIEFKLIVSGGGKSLEVSDFGGTYMIKSIVLDESITNRNYTAVLYDPEKQSFIFVPAVSARLKDGRSETLMRMPHNSIYVIMEADGMQFTDMTAHWAKLEVEYLASKRVVSGVSKTTYAPDRAITRAEFTALLVRALGLRVQAVADGNVFGDVLSDAWYAPVVEAGAKSELVSGMGEGLFSPEKPITREQIAVILSNARRLALGETVSDITANSMSKFHDAGQISPWAQDAMVEALANGLIQGITAHQLAPTATATRAQAAVMLERFMRDIGFLE